jgi:hypothetical protein
MTTTTTDLECLKKHSAAKVSEGVRALKEIRHHKWGEKKGWNGCGVCVGVNEGRCVVGKRVERTGGGLWGISEEQVQNWQKEL